jgi:hypothetical protein
LQAFLVEGEGAVEVAAGHAQAGQLVAQATVYGGFVGLGPRIGQRRAGRQDLAEQGEGGVRLAVGLLQPGQASDVPQAFQPVQLLGGGIERRQRQAHQARQRRVAVDAAVAAPRQPCAVGRVAAGHRCRVVGVDFARRCLAQRGLEAVGRRQITFFELPVNFQQAGPHQPAQVIACRVAVGAILAGRPPHRRGAFGEEREREYGQPAQAALQRCGQGAVTAVEGDGERGVVAGQPVAPRRYQFVGPAAQKVLRRDVAPVELAGQQRYRQRVAGRRPGDIARQRHVAGGIPAGFGAAGQEEGRRRALRQAGQGLVGARVESLAPQTGRPLAAGEQ